MASLKEQYIDGVINQSANRFPKYSLYNEDGTPWGIMMFQNITDYSVEGTTFGAEDVEALASGYCRFDTSASTGTDAELFDVISTLGWTDVIVTE